MENRLARQAHQALDVEGIGPDAEALFLEDVVGVEHHDLAALGPGEVVGHLVDEDMVALPDAAGREELARLHPLAEGEVELHALGGIGIEERAVGLHGDPERIELRADAQDVLVVQVAGVFQPAGVAGADFDVAFAEQGQVHEIERRVVEPALAFLRHGGHAVERRLHRARGDLERLDEIGPAGHGQRNGDDEHFDVFAPFGERARRQEPFRRGGRGLAGGIQARPIARAPSSGQGGFRRPRRGEVGRRGDVLAHALRVAHQMPDAVDQFLEPSFFEIVHSAIRSSI